MRIPNKRNNKIGITKIIKFLILIVFNIFIVNCNVQAEFTPLDWFDPLWETSPEIKQLIAQKEKQQSEYNVDGKSTGMVDLVVFMGQSNMVGKGDSSQAVDGIDGAGYEMEFNSLGEPYGLRKISEPFGDTEGPIGSMLTTGSMVTALMNAYYNNTGVPIVGIQTAISGSSVYTSWQDGQNGLENAKQKYTKTYEWLIQNGFKVRHKYMVWDQGEADKKQIEQYEDALKATVSEMQNIGIEKCFLIRIGGIYACSEADKEMYQQYVDMINKQTEICERNDDITLISTCESTLSRCYALVKEQVHLKQEALDITGSEAGTNMAKYALKYNDYTLSENQSNSLINFANNFSYFGTKNNAILYGTLVESYAYNLRPVSYADYKDGTRTLTYVDNNLYWNNLVTNITTKIGSYGANGETTFAQGNYIGLDCSGFASFLYHQVFGLPFDYENGMKYVPWTTTQYIENRKIKNYSGTEIKDTFKTVYQQVFKENTISMPEILNQVDLKVGDLIVGVGMPGEDINHVVIYAGKDENGKDKMIHSASNPVEYQMKYEDINKYYYMGETEFLSNHKYRALYVYRLNDEILPDNYVTHEEYQTKSDVSYIDFSKIKSGEKIDNVAPTGEVKVEYAENKTIVTINTNEDVMQIDGWLLSANKNTLIKEYTTDTIETVNLEDLEGNTSTLNLDIKIDKEAPTLNVEYSTTEATNQNVEVTIMSNEEIQEVEGWTLSLDKKALTKKYSENTKETVTIKDSAGNESQVQIVIENIKENGDINGDNEINITDVLLIKRHIIAGEKTSWQLTDDKLKLADLNDDGKVNVIDLIMIKRLILKNM